MKLFIFFGAIFCSVLALAQTATPVPVQTIVASVAASPVATGGVLAWLETNWQNVLLLILAVDAALIPLFPNQGFLVTIKNLLSNLAPKS